MFFNWNNPGTHEKRGIREVCNEALNVLLVEVGQNNLVCADRIDGYFREILSILDEQEDDKK